MDRAPSLTLAATLDRIGFDCEAGLDIPCSELNGGDGGDEKRKHRWDASKARLTEVVRVGLW